ncbi:response regulator [candidate division KSB1 bacterium]|nr:response regulator [candidate division KSB1 bacterium]
MDDGAFILLNILPLISAWFFGMAWGLTHSVLHFILLSILAAAAGKTTNDLVSTGIPAMAITLAVAGILGRIRDLTGQLRHELQERNRFEAELEHYRERLETLVDKRTEELLKSNARLREEIFIRERAETEKLNLEASLKRAEKMEAVGILAGSVAHDLNNILSGILSYPELILLDLPDDSPLRESILTIQKSGERAAAVVQDLLTLARRGLVNTHILNLNNIVNDFLKSPEFKQLASHYSRIALETKLNNDLLSISGSEIHLMKLVMNLVANAMEAMKHGGCLQISTANVYIDKTEGYYEVLPRGEYVTLALTDNGEGIAPKDLNRIFEPFYTTKVMGKSGSGLGLAIVWGTVKDHRGYIDVQSALGEGTTFTLYFPASREQSIDLKSKMTIDELKGNREIILVIDDDELQRNLCAAMLEKLNYHAITVESGERALELLKTQRVNLLVLDMIMNGGIDGCETYEQIIRLHPAQKAIIASGYNESDRVKKIQAMGAGEYIKKPYTLEMFGMAIRRELSN